MTTFAVKLNGTDISSRITQIGKVPFIKRNKNWSMQTAGYSFTMLQSGSPDPDIDDIITVEVDGTVKTKHYVIDVQEDDYNETYKIKVAHMFEKLKDYNVNYATLNTPFNNLTAAQYPTETGGYKAVRIDGVIEAMLLTAGIISTSAEYSVSFGASSPSNWRYLENMLYCANLDIAIQHQRICVWALRELEDDSPRDLEIKLIGTGHEIPDTILGNWTYWKTIHVHDNLVLHVFVNYGHLIGKR